MSRKETLAEYLARGGVIVKCEARPVEEAKEIVRSSNRMVQIYDLADGAFYFPEEKKVRTRKKTQEKKKQKADQMLSNVKVSLLCPNLMAKLSLAS